jgi:uncharacterized protein YggT (Ycf19 family)
MSVVIWLIQTLFGLYIFCLVGRSFLGMLLGEYHRAVVFLRRITEPVLAPIRQHVPPLRSGGAYWDLSPVVAVILLSVIEWVLVTALRSAF